MQLRPVLTAPVIPTSAMGNMNHSITLLIDFYIPLLVLPHSIYVMQYAEGAICSKKV